ncbi:MAG: four helix bundle protein [Ignavibacteria bacterium]|nr:four helix bundle protein [Ignavibacteria bacterium]
MKQNVIVEKSYMFAVNTIIAVRKLKNRIDSYILIKQLLRAGTSIGANVEESQGGYSRKDFNHKLNIAYKEARECKYWIRLIVDTQVENEEQKKIFDSLFNDADELCRIIYKINFPDQP